MMIIQSVLKTMVLFKFVAFIVLLLQFGIVSAFDDSNDDAISLTFEDNVDGKFSSFAKTNLRLSRQAKMELSPSRIISYSQYERLIEESRSNANPYYTLKIFFKRRSNQDYIMTSIPMCLVVQAEFQYTATLFVNENGYIVSVHVSTGNSTCSQLSTAAIQNKNDFTYKVNLHLQLADVGPQPDTQHFLDKIKREQEAKLNSQENDNRPFILKYWKYLLPFVVIVLLQGVFTNDAGGGGAGGGR